MTRRIALLVCAMLLSLSMAIPALADVQRSDPASPATNSIEVPREEQTEDTESAEQEPREPSSISDNKTTCLLVIAVLFGSILVLGPLVHRGRTHGQGAVSDKQRGGS